MWEVSDECRSHIRVDTGLSEHVKDPRGEPFGGSRSGAAGRVDAPALCAI